MKAEPMYPYGLGKWFGEENCRLFYSLYGVETMALRYFNVFGKRQDPQSEYAAVIPKFIKAVLAGRGFNIGSGKSFNLLQMMKCSQGKGRK